MKKFLPYILILIVVIGFFSFIPKKAVAGCFEMSDPSHPIDLGLTQIQCDVTKDPLKTERPSAKVQWLAVAPPNTLQGAAAPTSPSTGNPLYDHLKSCGVIKGSLEGCLVQIVYFFFYGIPSFLLVIAAKFFDALVAIGLSSKLYNESSFIPGAWAIVRDLSNIFFILILLYVAVQTILGIGGHDGPKKVITQVIIMALLINFSMFFTKVVIDSANILALTFYNKINVETTQGENEKPIANIPVTNIPGEKGISAGFANAFHPDRLMDEKFFQDLKAKGIVTPVSFANKLLIGGVAILNPIAGLGVAAYTIAGHYFPADEIPTSTLLAIIIISGLIMGFAAYCFFIAGLSFLGRLIELWVLIIFSPFAFMSSTLPSVFGKVEQISWDAWLKQLMKSAFMAPIFMFFLYFIFKVINSKIFEGLARSDEAGRLPYETIILIIIPALVVLMLLMKATSYAKKGAGQIGEAVISTAKTLGGLAIGGGALGIAALARAPGGIGSFMKGSSTGDTAANRMQGSAARIAAHQAIIANPASNIVQRTQARKEIWRERRDQITGNIQQRLGVQAAQTWVGARLNQDQHNIEHAAHARHELDEAANAVSPGKKWDELNGEKRFEARRKMERDRVVRDNAGAAAAPVGAANYVAGLGGVGLGTRKWDALTGAERDAIDAVVGAQVGGPHAGQAVAGGRLDMNATHADQTIIQAARVKQGVVSSAVQSTVTGTYDVRNLANVIAKQQSTGFAKIAAALTGGIAMGLRGGFKGLGVNYGTSQGAFLKDLGNTITDALKSAKINVDLSHVGEQKKEDGSGGHH